VLLVDTAWHQLVSAAAQPFLASQATRPPAMVSIYMLPPVDIGMCVTLQAPASNSSSLEGHTLSCITGEGQLR
jgi:hypothetical protein